MTRNRLKSAWKRLLLILVSLTCVYPVFWMLLGSFKTQGELYSNPWGFPQMFTLENYRRAFGNGNIGRCFMNSLLIAACSVVLIVLLSVMAAYGITRLKWKLSSLVLTVFVTGMMIPAYSALIPLYSIFNKFGILGSYTCVVISHVTFGLPLGVFIMSGFMQTIPRELEEAAVLDGCTVFQMFCRVIMPIVRSGTVTISVISFINVWNDLLFGQIFLNEKQKMPLTVGLLEFKGRFGTDYVGMLAAIVVTVIPVVAIYSVLHDKIVDGMTAGAVKG